eukprot:SAG11_NODE_384_length_9897_cov_11.158502_4_plen_102_part_00
MWRPQDGGDGASFALVCENEITAGRDGTVAIVEIVAEEQCHVLDQDVVGWYHAGQGVTDYDDGGNAVKWVGMPSAPAVGDVVSAHTHGSVVSSPQFVRMSG